MNIVITGASNGLGAELAKLYGRPNITLGLLGRDLTRLEQTAQICQNQGANVTFTALDITHSKELMSWLNDFDTQHPIDLVVANAGKMETIKNNNDCLESNLSIQSIFDTNFFGSLNTINPVLIKMLERKRGHVVIISSLSAHRGIPLFPAYSASKAALKTYYEGVRGVLFKHNIFVTIVCPSFINTPMIKGHSFQKMFIMNTDYAARYIKKSISKRRRIINFPLHHLFGIKSLELLPNRISDWILIKLFGL